MRHSLFAGKSAIDALERLGRALGYETTREHLVGSSAAVDLSWTAAEYNDVPLFVFEVESTASAGLASNATKVFGSSLETLPKPLFFFHLVMTAGPTNERILNAQRAWGSHNYRVYRISDASDRQEIVADILRQHRRVSNRVDILRFIGAVDQAGWADRESILDILTLLEDLRFDESYLHALARLSLYDLAYLPRYARRALALSTSRADAPGREGYRGGPGDYVGGLLELALVITAGELSDEEGAEALERWATSTGTYPRAIDAAFRLSRDYDGFVLGIAPYQYALAAAVLHNAPNSLAWVIRDLYRLLVAEQSVGVVADYRLLGGVWLPHLLVSARAHGAIPDAELEDMYACFERCAIEAGGVPAGWLESPPLPVSDLDDLNARVESVSGRTGPPSWVTLAGPKAGRGANREVDASTSAVRWCLEALTTIDVYRRPTEDLIALLRPAAG